MSTWREKARCRKADTDRELNPDADPNLFVDTVYGERAGAREVRHSKAAEFCVRCTVRDECRAEGLANSEEGVWGQWLMPMPRPGHKPRPKLILTASQERNRRNARDRAARARRNGESEEAS
jgi:hypothetical protein